jgi:hypothetical protein
MSTMINARIPTSSYRLIVKNRPAEDDSAPVTVSGGSGRRTQTRVGCSPNSKALTQRVRFPRPNQHDHGSAIIAQIPREAKRIFECGGGIDDPAADG